MGDLPTIKLSAPEYRAFWKLPVLRETGGLLALDKPAHLLVSPDKLRANDPVLTKLLQRDLKDQATWTRDRDYSFLDLVYPLDLEATGVVLYATEKTAFEWIRNEFGSRQITFLFTALVHGSPDADEFEIDLKLASHPTRPWLVRVSKNKGKQTRTQCRVMERYRNHTLLECHTKTLRPQQIRVHLMSLGFPVVGDSLYGGDVLMLSQLKRKYRGKRSTPEKPLIDRTATHLSSIEFSRQGTEDSVIIESKLAKDLEVSLKCLRQYSR